MGGRPWGIRFQGESDPENGFDKRDRGPSNSRFPPHESRFRVSTLCVGPTINFRQPSCPLDFCSGGMEYHRRRGFLQKSIEETAQCIVTIRD